VAGRWVSSGWQRTVVGGAAAAALVAVMVAGSTGVAAAQGHGRGQDHGRGAHPSPPRGFAFGHVLKGVVAADPAPTSTGFTLDAVGCSTPLGLALTSSTTFDELGTDNTPTGVGAGDRVVVTVDPGASSLTAESVTILVAHVSGAVASIGAGSVVVTDGQGFDRTVDVSGATAFTPGGTALSTLVVGQGVDASGPVDADNVSLDALSVHVRPATAPESAAASARHAERGALVVGVVATTPPPTAGGFTVDVAGGTALAVSATPPTTYVETGATTPPTGVVSGEHVAVLLTGDPTARTAKRVVIFLNQLDGTVVSVASSSVVIADHQGFWRSVDVSGATAYGPSGTSLGSLAAGDHVAAFGTVDVDGVSLDALFVHRFTTPAPDSDSAHLWKTTPSTCPASAGSSTAAGIDAVPPGDGSTAPPPATFGGSRPGRPGPGHGSETTATAVEVGGGRPRSDTYGGIPWPGPGSTPGGPGR